jgi:prepilin-type N-terminal cleavage/methylation domain-containing protein
MTRRRPGFTLLEMAAAVAILGLILAAFGRAFVTAASLGAESEARSLASDDSSRAVLAISSALRGAAYGTLSGIVVGTPTSSVTYQHVTGADAAGVTYGPLEQIQWQPTSGDVDGIAQPGRVVLLRGLETTVLAPRVEYGGFSITRQGTLLKVSLTAYASTSKRRVSRVTRESTVHLRN